MVSEEILKRIMLNGKVAAVTGAASGIGLGIVKRLAEAGANIALLDIDEKGGRRALKIVEEVGVDARFYRCDVTSNLQCGRVAERVYEDFGRIDILVNSAGVIVRKDVVETSEEEWDLVLDVNLKGVYLTSHHFIPYIVRDGGGCIINIGSGWGLKGGPKAASYCASKGGVVNLTRAMAIDHGGERVRVNCICPGDVDTPLLRGEAYQLGVDLTKFLEEAADRPIKRVGRPEDIADAVLYLASDLSSWVTGAILVVDGGGLA